jgi:hypothetical protein
MRERAVVMKYRVSFNSIALRYIEVSIVTRVQRTDGLCLRVELPTEYDEVDLLRYASDLDTESPLARAVMNVSSGTCDFECARVD